MMALSLPSNSVIILFLFLLIQYGCTVRTSGCPDINFRITEWTFFCCRFRLIFFHACQCTQSLCYPVNHFKHNKYYQRCDQKIDDSRNEITIMQNRCILSCSKRNRKVRKVRASENSQNWCQDICIEGCHNGRKCAADNNTDRHIHHISTQNKLLGTLQRICFAFSLVKNLLIFSRSETALSSHMARWNFLSSHIRSHEWLSLPTEYQSDLR